MVLLTPTLGSHDHFHPESPLLLMVACCIRRSWRYSPMFSRGIVPVAFAIPYHQNITMDKCIHQSFLPLFSVGLVITRYHELLSIAPRKLCDYCLVVSCRLITPTNYSSHLPRICFSPVVHVFRKRLRNTIRSSENPEQPIALEILACLHYG